MVASEPLATLIDDLDAETGSLVSVVDGADDAALLTPTPAAGWDVRDQLAHLAGFDAAAVRALVDPDGFARSAEADRVAGIDPVAHITELGRRIEAPHALDWFESARRSLIEAARHADPSVRVPWYGPAMGVMSFLSARLMETWAHGVDVRDAFGVAPVDSSRLRHVAHLGVGARAYSYRVNHAAGAETPIRVELTASAGERWTWGPAEATDVVCGSALDFCLVVTQRRHLSDVGLDITGAEAQRWMSFAQAFAGPAGSGRSPLS